MKKVMLIVALSLVASSAYSFSHHHGGTLSRDGKILSGSTTATMAAPEIDPGSSIAALTLLVGGLAVVMGRRSI